MQLPWKLLPRRYFGIDLWSRARESCHWLTGNCAKRMSYPTQPQRAWADVAKAAWLTGTNFCKTWPL